MINEILEENRKLVLDSNVSDSVLESFLMHEEISIYDLKSDSDRVLYYFSFINEHFTDEMRSNYIEDILDITKIVDYNLFYKIMERIDNNVRKKI